MTSCPYKIEILCWLLVSIKFEFCNNNAKSIYWPIIIVSLLLWDTCLPSSSLALVHVWFEFKTLVEMIGKLSAFDWQVTILCKLYVPGWDGVLQVATGCASVTYGCKPDVNTAGGTGGRPTFNCVTAVHGIKYIILGNTAWLEYWDATMPGAGKVIYVFGNTTLVTTAVLWTNGALV
jgi:hypothetical protein